MTESLRGGKVGAGYDSPVDKMDVTSRWALLSHQSALEALATRTSRIIERANRDYPRAGMGDAKQDAGDL
jgi:hypothetical protein